MVVKYRFLMIIYESSNVRRESTIIILIIYFFLIKTIDHHKKAYFVLELHLEFESNNTHIDFICKNG